MSKFINSNRIFLRIGRKIWSKVGHGVVNKVGDGVRSYLNNEIWNIVVMATGDQVAGLVSDYVEKKVDTGE